MAFGHRWYSRMAAGLLSSIRLHSDDVVTALITDDPTSAAARLADIVVPARDEYGTGVVQKLYLDHYTPFDKTLFVDSDCLFYGDANRLWATYDTGTPFGVMGSGYIYRGDQHVSVDDIDDMLDALEIDRLPLFNGGIYFFDRSAEARSVFGTARDLLTRREELRLTSFKGAAAADEPIFAAALELEGIDTLPSDGRRTMSDVHEDIERLGSLDVAKGLSRHVYKGSEFSPLVVHFNYSAQYSFAYRRELARLSLPRALAFTAPLVAVVDTLPHSVKTGYRHYRYRIATRYGEDGIRGLIPERLALRARQVWERVRGTNARRA